MPDASYFVERTVATTVPLVFTALHLLFFAFDRRAREHLWFAVLSACFGAAAYIEYTQGLGPEPGPWTQLVGPLLVFAILLAGLRLMHERLYEATPRHFWWMAGASVAALAVIAVAPAVWAPLVGVFFVAWLVESARLAPRYLRSADADAWLLAAGLAVLTVTGILDVAIDLGALEGFLGTTNPWLFGAVAFLLSTSVHLAREFARTNRELERRLEEVERLSEERLRQERAAREQEVARRLLEAENRRRGEELEEARRLQLAMLPERLPETDGFELAAFTQTATEVGGDSYDVHPHADGALTVALADAVGHGARAGTVVAVGKGLFHLLAEERGDLGEALARFNRALLATGLERASLALLLARLEPGRVHLAAAGIPPPLLSRADGAAVRELASGALPLGSSSLGRYLEHAVELAPGDTLLLATDGLAEAASSSGEAFGYERVRRAFAREAASAREEGAPAGRIPGRLWREVSEWSADERPADDVTVLVLRAKIVPE